MLQEKKQQLLELLKLHYGFNSFRAGQEKVIDNVLAGKSTVVIMPTGGGKSLCYQLPALVLDGVTFVISPLIALMKDQVDSLNKIGIPATFVNSSISQAETANRLEAVKNGQYKLLYIAPERFYNQEFLTALKNIKVSLFAIDEAHCISQWGHDFRPSYLKLNHAREILDNPPVLALTATATPEVRADIIVQLGLSNPELVITGFARPNLQFGVIQATDARKSQIVLDAISSAPDQSGIIYVGTRARADDLLQILLENNIEAVSYHAGMEAEDRKWVQENFMKGKAKVIVATNAFGLGIDKPDIRFVIHYDMPGTVEAYYQEAGRAGRDGKPSFCLMLYGSRDRYLQEFFIKGDNPPPEIILEIYDILKNFDSDTVLITYAELAEMLSDQMPEMAIGTSLKILEHEGYISRMRERNGLAYIKLKASTLERDRQNSPPKADPPLAEKLKTIDFNKSKKRQEIWEKMLNKYGNELDKGWYFNPEEIAEILSLKKDSFLRAINKFKNIDLVEYNPPFRGTEINILKKVDTSEVKLDFNALKEKLKRAYEKLDKLENYIYHFGCRPKYILDYFGENNALACSKCDNCLSENGYERKHKQPIKKHGRRHADISPSRKKYEEPKKTKVKLTTKLTQLETFELYNKGLSLEQISKARKLKTETIANHLCFLIEKRLPVDISKFVSSAKQKKIILTAREVGFEKLSPIKDALGESVTWEEIKLTLAKMKLHKL